MQNKNKKDSDQGGIQLPSNIYKAYTVNIFPSVLRHCWLGDRKDIRPVKNCLFVGGDDLTGALHDLPSYQYSSSCHHHYHHPCFNKHRLTQVHLEKWPLKRRKRQRDTVNIRNRIWGSGRKKHMMMMMIMMTILTADLRQKAEVYLLCWIWTRIFNTTVDTPRCSSIRLDRINASIFTPWNSCSEQYCNLGLQ